MMNDAISRTALLRKTRPVPSLVAKRFGDEWQVEMVTLEDIIDAPALDVEPVIHASWIEDGYRGIPCVCSHCGEEAHYTSTFREQFDYDWEENLVPCGYEEIREYVRSKRCPECGAKMDGETE